MLADERTGNVVDPETEQRAFPWWRALTTRELVDLDEVAGDFGGVRPESPETLGLWTQTKVWAEGIEVVSEILQIDQMDLSNALSLAEIEGDLSGLIAPPEWEAARQRWWSRGTVGDSSSHMPYQSLVQGAVDELREAMKSVLPEPNSRQNRLVHAVAGALLDLPPLEDVQNLTTRTLVQELHYQAGNEDSSATFGELIARQGFEEHLTWKYPVLTRLVVTRLLFWQARLLEFLKHLMLDLPVLEEEKFLHFSNHPEGTLQNDPDIIDISIGAGDSHLEGRSVIVVRTRYGVLVYKPRGGTNEIALQRLRDRLFGDDGPLSFAVPRVIDRGSWSWHEHIKDDPLTVEDAAGAARTLGALSAVINLLGGNDFHHENVRFADGRACPVDLETIVRVDARQATQPLDENADPAFRVLMDSVAVAGIVPGKIVSRTPDGGIEATDISVVGYASGQRTPMVVPTLSTDEAGLPRIVEALIDDDGGPGEPLLRMHGEEFLEGFLAATAACRTQVTLAAGPDDLVDYFDRAQLRYIPRPTMVYAKLLSESFHPFFLQFGTARDVVLAKAWNGYANAPGRLELIRSEYRSLLVGDIPHISCSLDDRSPWDGEGAGAPTIRERLATRLIDVLDPTHVEYQKRVIEQSFASIGAPVRNVDTLGRLTTGETANGPARSIMGRAVAGFREVEETLASTTLIAASAAHWTVAPVGFETYNGRAGMLLADHALQVGGTGEVSLHHDLLLRSVRPMEAIVHAGLAGDGAALRAMDVGAASSLAGWAACLATVPGLRRDIDVEDAGRGVVELLIRLIDEDKTFDVMSGSAGAIATALVVSGIVDDDRRHALITKATRHLKVHAEEAAQGIGWRDPETDQLLGGFSHGAAGIATYLLAGARETGDSDALLLGRVALDFDDSLFDANTLNWPDLRVGLESAASMRAWCHGSPGALLARALSWNSLDEARQQKYGQIFDPVSRAILDEIDESLLSTGADFLGDCLCHGRIGNLVILRMLAETGFLQHGTHERLERTVEASINSIGSRGPRLGGLPGAPIPDLFMGLSGVAWGLRRLTGTTQPVNWEALSFGLAVPRRGVVHTV